MRRFTIFFAHISCLLIYMKKFLHSDWLRAVQKRVNSVQKEVTNQAF